MDNLTTETIDRIMQEALRQLPFLHYELVRVVYFEKVRAPKRLFQQNHGIDGQQFDRVHADALSQLKEFFSRFRIKGLFDIL
jgi:hypothetical protein